MEYNATIVINLHTALGLLTAHCLLPIHYTLSLNHTDWVKTMKKLILFTIVIAGVGLAGAGLWWWQNNGTTEPGYAEAPGEARLIPDTPIAKADHIPMGELTDERIEETSSAVALPEVEADGYITPIAETVELAAGPDDSLSGGDIPVDEVIVVPEPEVDPAPVEEEFSDTPRIAVLPFKLMGSTSLFEADTGEILCDALITEIDSEAYEVYQRDRLELLLQEKDFQSSLLVDGPTGAARLGRLVGVRYIVLGTVARLGGQYHMSGRLVDCASGRIGTRGRVTFRTMRDWPNQIAELVNLLGLRRGSIPEPETSDPVTANTLLASVNPQAGFNVTIQTAEEKQTYLEGENIQFVVSAGRSCYITLMTVDSQGEVLLLLPNKLQRQSEQQSVFLRADQLLTLPSPGMGFEFPIIPPHGESYVKVIATLQPLRLSELRAGDFEEDMFKELTPGVKAIGLAAVANRPAVSISTDQSLGSVLPAGEWATDELFVVTAAPVEEPFERITETNTIEPVPGGSGDPFDLGPVRDHINARIRHRFRELTRSAIQSPALVLRSPAHSYATTVRTDEYLVFYRDREGFDTIRGNRAWSSARNKVNVKVVVPNLTLFAYNLPQTRLAEVQWALENRFTPGRDLGLASGYDIHIKRKSVLIGLVDGPVDWQDPRISHAAWKNPQETPDNFRDDDDNGYVDDVSGWNFVEGSNRLCKDPYRFNHGTALVSIMAGRNTNSDYDVIGVAPQAKIVTAVVLSDPSQPQPWQLTSTLDRIIQGIRYVVDQGAEIVNCSFGAQVSRDQLKSLNQIPLWDELEKAGVVLICAAGNDHIDIDRQPVFPASLPRANIVTVGATDAAGQPGAQWNPEKETWLPFTNYGQQTIDTTAPGACILAATSRGKADLLNGTSFAAAIVSAMRAVE